MKHLLIIFSILLLSSFLVSCEKKDGFGTETFDDGSKYEGEWKDGKPNGPGTLTTADESKYVGEFKDGNFHGQGTFFYPAGQKFVGEFKDGDWWNGTLYGKNGNIRGKYVNGKEIKE